MKELMKAVIINKFGSSKELELGTVSVPVIQHDEVLVKIHAASVNPVDWKVREGMLSEMIPHQFPLTLGWDFAGEIVSVGDTVKDWNIGDAVYSRPDIARNGSNAEYIAVKANEIAHKPQSLDWQKAAAVPLVTLTAWQALYEIAKLKPNDKVLIHAGAGGVGIAAIQLAKLRGAYVYTTASVRNIEFLQDLGADHVIDYNSEDFSTLRDVNVVFDTIRGEIQNKSWQTLVKGGCLVSIIDPPPPEDAKPYGVRAEFCFVQPSSEQLNNIAKLIDDNKLKVEIDSVYRLDQIAQAHARSESGHSRGKIIIQIS